MQNRYDAMRKANVGFFRHIPDPAARRAFLLVVDETAPLHPGWAAVDEYGQTSPSRALTWATDRRHDPDPEIARRYVDQTRMSMLRAQDPTNGSRVASRMLVDAAATWLDPMFAGGIEGLPEVAERALVALGYAALRDLLRLGRAVGVVVACATAYPGALPSPLSTNLGLRVDLDPNDPGRAGDARVYWAHPATTAEQVAESLRTTNQ